MISPDARVDGDPPADLVAGAFAVVDRDARLGSAVTIGDGARVLGGTVLGDAVHVGPGAHVGPFVDVEAGAVVGANAVVQGSPQARTVVARGARVDPAAVVAPGVIIAHDAHVHAGTIVDRNVPAFAIVAGNPARIVGYADAVVAPEQAAAPTDLSVVAADGVRWIEGISARDLRGSLAAYEAPAQLPFRPARAYLVYGVREGSARGEHAHRTCDEVLVCVSGAVDVLIDTGRARASVRLEDPARGLYLPAMTWRVLINHTPGAVLLVLASEPYDAAEYVRDHAEFEALVAAR